MSARDLIERLVAAGVPPIEAGCIIAEAFAEGARQAPVPKSVGALRTERWREKRHKASQSVTSDAAPATSQNVTERHTVTHGDAALARVVDITSTSVLTGKKKTKTSVVDLEFETVYRAYPHHKGRSSKPKALVAWKALSDEHRQAMPAAVSRYASEGREPKAECGAKAFELWLKDQRYLDWIEVEHPPPRILTQAEKDAHDANIRKANGFIAEIASNSHLPPLGRDGGGVRWPLRG